MVEERWWKGVEDGMGVTKHGGQVKGVCSSFSLWPLGF